MRAVKTLIFVLVSFWGIRVTFALGPVGGSDLPPTDLERVQVGTKAPDFTLEDTAGARVSLSQFRGKKNVVLVFYRGHW